MQPPFQADGADRCRRTDLALTDADGSGFSQNVDLAGNRPKHHETRGRPAHFGRAKLSAVVVRPIGLVTSVR